jgi:hypothetical protein
MATQKWHDTTTASDGSPKPGCYPYRHVLQGASTRRSIYARTLDAQNHHIWALDILYHNLEAMCIIWCNTEYHGTDGNIIWCNIEYHGTDGNISLEHRRKETANELGRTSVPVYYRQRITNGQHCVASLKNGGDVNMDSLTPSSLIAAKTLART